MTNRSQKSILMYVTELVRLNRECLEVTRRILDGAPWPNLDRLIEGLEERKRIITRTKEIDNALETKEEYGRFTLIDVPEDQKQAVAEKLEELRQTVKTLVEHDRRLRTEVERLKGQVSGELKKVRTGHTALKAYSPYKAPRNFLIDKKG